jgi:hypothetical protein
MKRMILLVVILLSLTGCMLPTVDQVLPTIEVISKAGYINRPLVNGVDDWEVQPGAKESLDFSSGYDAIGNRTGLDDDSRWTIYEVRAFCPDPNAPDEDTIFWPKKFARNICGWFPGYKGLIEGVSTVPYLLQPFSIQPDPHIDYPFDSCASRNVAEMASQMATITASARAEWIEVEITLPERSDGQYTLDLPGYTPTGDNVLTVRLSGPQEIIATWTNGTSDASWLFVVPVDYFWINGSWEIPVGPSGMCG